VSSPSYDLTFVDNWWTNIKTDQKLTACWGET
jgi:hypothetical protein